MLNHIRPSQLKDWLAQSAGSTPAVVLDVREPWEVQTATVQPEGFHLVTMPMASVPARATELPKNQAIACLCHHGGRSAQVAQYLMNQGYTQVVNIHGGIHAWSTELDSSIPQY